MKLFKTPTLIIFFISILLHTVSLPNYSFSGELTKIKQPVEKNINPSDDSEFFKLTLKIDSNQEIKKSNPPKKWSTDLVYIKGGCYLMGNTFKGGDRDEGPAHDVCVSDYYLGEHEVTQKEWIEIMGSNPSAFPGCGPNCPVEMVSWYDVQNFFKKLRKKTGQNYRLPYEVEWEFAARERGKKLKWAGTSSRNDLDNYSWHFSNSGGTPHPVEQRKPNSLGLYDMSGNVFEWVHDYYGSNYYSKSPHQDPRGMDSGTERVTRGGGWSHYARSSRVTYRYSFVPEYSNTYLGFRVLLEP